MTEILPELFTGPSYTFSEHLNLDDNNRILFSGKFGIGKTTFINHYFERNKDQYNVIHLYPINYSVLENEDVFKYIKYDILIGLLTIGDKPNSPEYTDLFKDIPDFLLTNFLSIFGTLALLSPKLGRPINQFVKELKAWKEKYADYRASESQKADSEISDFLKEIHSDEGGLYEYGYLTNIIINWLISIKTSKRENILIIDDLDRIDPNHIFRILNIFSAHFDSRDKSETKNKFGFDKVILVCDIENIKNIYQAQFGVNTDFNGYVDKFYSKDIYKFDNRENLYKLVQTIVERMQIGVTIEGQFTNWNFNYRFRQDLILFLEALVNHNQINLRAILKYVDKRIDMINHIVYINGKTFLSIKNHLTLSLGVLSKIVGDLEILKHKFSNINAISNFRERHTIFEGLIGDIAFLNAADNFVYSNYGLIIKQENIVTSGDHKTDFTFDIESKDRGDFYWAKIRSIKIDHDENEYVNDPNFYKNHNIAPLLNSALLNISE